MFDDWRKSRGVFIDHSDNKISSLKSNLNLILALPLYLCIMLGLRRDLISINDKGEYVWNDNTIEAQSYISSKMKTFCSDLLTL